MKKIKMLSGLCVASLALANFLPVHAEDYSNEDAWYDRCTKPQTDQAGITACQGFQDYQAQKRQELQNSIDAYNNDLSSLKSDAQQIEALAKQQKVLVDSLTSEISKTEKAIEKIEKEIEKLVKKIEEKQKEIDKWDAQIKDRMRSEQTNVGTNILIDLIMGSQDLNDMLRRISGVERITEDDQDQIDKLNKLKAQLEQQKSEQERLEKETVTQKEQLEVQRTSAKELEESYKQLVVEYQKQMADLEAQMRAAQADIASIRSFTITSGSFTGDITQVDGFIRPVSGSVSAGTWAYPGGGLHLGLDIAAPIGTAVVAPANGVILYANNPAPTNGGYLGNWIGHPAGGGNTIEMLCNVGGTLYAVSFAHLSQNGFAVSAGQSVSQGQVLALTGNSGNSSGPHCHIEVYNLGSMSVEEAISRFSSTADFAWGTGWNTTSTACGAGATPCRERPEKFF